MTLDNQSEVARRDTRRAISVLRTLLAALALACAGLAGTPAATADPASTQAQEWWIARLGLHDVWQISKGAGVTVAVLDTGVDATFGDLAGAVVPGFLPGGGVSPGVDTDPEIHGTRMADDIAGRGTGFGLLGVAPRAKIMPVIIPLDGGGNGPTTIALDQLSAMANPPQVVNMSYGTPGPCPSDLQAAVRRAVNKGMILVSSSGNDGADINVVSAPADCAGIVAVGAYDFDTHAWPDSGRHPYVALSAPGVHLIGFRKATGGVGFADGTSDSAAIVSGTFAVVRAHFPTMPSRQLVARVLATARQFSGAQGTRNDVWGYGAARPHHALTDAVPATAPNPIYDALDRLGGQSSAPASPSASSTAAGRPGTANPPGAAASTGSGSKTGVLVALGAGIAVVVLIIVGLAVRSRRGRPVHAPPYPGGYGPPGP